MMVCSSVLTGGNGSGGGEGGGLIAGANAFSEIPVPGGWLAAVRCGNWKGAVAPPVLAVDESGSGSGVRSGVGPNASSSSSCIPSEGGGAGALKGGVVTNSPKSASLSPSFAVMLLECVLDCDESKRLCECTCPRKYLGDDDGGRPVVWKDPKSSKPSMV